MNSKNEFKELSELPITLNATQISHVLGLSKAGAYNLLASKDFPTLRVGKRRLVLKDKFIEWMEINSGVAV